MKNQIVFDFKGVDLYEEHRILYALVYIFCCSFRSIFCFIAVKNCTKAYHIICSLYRYSFGNQHNWIFYFIIFL
jgi:hypothetical protein